MDFFIFHLTIFLNYTYSSSWLLCKMRRERTTGWRRKGSMNVIRRLHCGIALVRCVDFSALLALFSVTKFCCEEIVDSRFKLDDEFGRMSRWCLGCKISGFSHWFRGITGRYWDQCYLVRIWGLILIRIWINAFWDCVLIVRIITPTVCGRASDGAFWQKNSEGLEFKTVATRVSKNI